ncbi:LPS O-antigen length regulator [Pseudoalteromonas sp. NSLLW24]|uniref:Wzz/FepE/Etk N-terminal domain-containing protein n=1 Tax=Pseudoalteromonas sp. NSLLW24 TaxID=2792050 RepID=UPI0018CE8DCD|nr:Wzz/FepE/Etk N-terminal domain-containing protein [Pseudoalteromonas sp. NSLLW24]MBG9999184.1 LPS O-antigen length regulator [Pseudoalteromonas sp. NSLLW24]
MSNKIKEYHNELNYLEQDFDAEINLKELLSVLWKRKFIIIFTSILFTFIAVFYALSLPDTYKSEALLTAAEQKESGGLGGLSGQFGGLASLAGINLGAASDNKTQLAIEVLKSRQFTSEFIQNHNILPNLMAVKSWNSSTNDILYNEDVYLAEQKKWVREISAPFKPKPSMQEAYRAFSKVVSINTLKDTGMITISIEHVSPVVAKQWVDWLIADINSVMKKRDVAEANRSTDFLVKQLDKTKIADIRSILYKLIEEQAKTIMFANVRDEYVFKTVDPAIVAEIKSGPKRAFICIFAAILGFILATISVLTLYFLKKED